MASGQTDQTGRGAAIGHEAARGEVFELTKAGHTWRLRCETGGEAALLSRLSELAASADAPFDWFDLALVSHQLSRRLERGISRAPGVVSGG